KKPGRQRTPAGAAGSRDRAAHAGQQVKVLFRRAAVPLNAEVRGVGRAVFQRGVQPVQDAGVHDGNAAVPGQQGGHVVGRGVGGLAVLQVAAGEGIGLLRAGGRGHVEGKFPGGQRFPAPGFQIQAGQAVAVLGQQFPAEGQHRLAVAVHDREAVFVQNGLAGQLAHRDGAAFVQRVAGQRKAAGADVQGAGAAAQAGGPVGVGVPARAVLPGQQPFQPGLQAGGIGRGGQFRQPGERLQPGLAGQFGQGVQVRGGGGRGGRGIGRGGGFRRFRGGRQGGGRFRRGGGFGGRFVPAAGGQRQGQRQRAAPYSPTFHLIPPLPVLPGLLHTGSTLSK